MQGPGRGTRRTSSDSQAALDILIHKQSVDSARAPSWTFLARLVVIPWTFLAHTNN